MTENLSPLWKIQVTYVPPESPGPYKFWTSCVVHARTPAEARATAVSQMAAKYGIERVLKADIVGQPWDENELRLTKRCSVSVPPLGGGVVGAPG